MINDHVLKPLISKCNQKDWINNEVEVLDDQMISVGTTCITSKVTNIVRYVLNGHAAVLTIGDSNAIIAKVTVRSWSGWYEAVKKSSFEQVDGALEKILGRKPIEGISIAGFFS